MVFGIETGRKVERIGWELILVQHMIWVMNSRDYECPGLPRAKLLDDRFCTSFLFQMITKFSPIAYPRMAAILPSL